MTNLKPLMPFQTYLKKAHKTANEAPGTIVAKATPAGDLARDLHALGLRYSDGIPATKIDPAAYSFITRKELISLRNSKFLSRSELARILDVDVVKIARWLKPGKNLADRLPIKKADLNQKITSWRSSHAQGLGRNAFEIARGNYRP